MYYLLKHRPWLLFIRRDLHTEQFQAVIDQPIAEFPRHNLLQLFDLFVVELDDFTGLQVYQVVVVVITGFLVACSSIPEVDPLNNAGILEQPDRSVNSGNGDAVINRRRPPVHLLDIWMVVGLGNDLRDDPTLLGHPHALVLADLFDPVH